MITKDSKTNSLVCPVPITSIIHVRLIQHHKLAIDHECHIFIRILDDIISCALANIHPARKVFDRHAPTGKLIDGPITLSVEVGGESGQVISMAVWMVVAVLKPG